MNRADLVAVAVDEGLSQREARNVVNVIFDSIRESLQREEAVELPFGTFEVIERNRPPLRGWFLNRVRVTYKQRKMIRFTFGEV